MTILAYRPDDDQFWLSCNKEEAERWFIPRLDEKGMKSLNGWFELYASRKRQEDHGKEYEDMVKEMMCVDEIAYAYFNVSRDLSVCYAEMAHHPFHQLWNGYSPFCPCEHVEIKSPDELRFVEPIHPLREPKRNDKD